MGSIPLLTKGGYPCLKKILWCPLPTRLVGTQQSLTRNQHEGETGYAASDRPPAIVLH